MEIEEKFSEFKEYSSNEFTIKNETIEKLKGELLMSQDHILMLEEQIETQTLSNEELKELRLQNEDLIRQLAEATEKIRDNYKCYQFMCRHIHITQYQIQWLSI